MASETKEIVEKNIEAVAETPAYDLKQIVEEVVAKQAEELKAAVKNVAFNEKPQDEVEAKRLSKREETVAWLKATSMGDVKTLKKIHENRAKALNETTAAQGGYLVPEEFESAIIRFMDASNQIAQNSTQVTMGTDVRRLNTLASEPVAYIVAEQSAITASQPSFGEPVLTAKKYAAITDWTSELQEDTEVDNLLGIVAERIARAIVVKQQQEYLSGATSGSEGILAVSGVTASAFTGAASTLDWDDLSLMIAELQAIDLEDGAQAKFYMAPQTYHYLRTLKASGDGNYFLPAAPSAETPASAWGKEIVIVKEMTKQSSAASGNKFVFFSDLKKHAFVGNRRGITTKVLEEGTVGSVNLGEQDMRALRVTTRSAFVTALQTGIVTLAPTA